MEQAGMGTNDDTNREEQQQTAEGNPPLESNISSTKEPESFAELMQKPLSSLLEDLGEQDTDWQNTKVAATAEQDSSPPKNDTPAVSQKQQQPETPNRLERHGKAPIHVEFVSFGYRHGLPRSVGGSYAQPLAAIDARQLAPVPPYLAWMDGTSGAVRNAMIRGNNHNRTNDSSSNSTAPLIHVRDFVRDNVVQPTAHAMQQAISTGGHGYALPLRMSVFVGSEEGRHRSVVAAELAATALRKLLRANVDHAFGAPVSVGTRHRDIHVQQQQQQSKKHSNTAAKGRKQKEFEDD